MPPAPLPDRQHLARQAQALRTCWSRWRRATQALARARKRSALLVTQDWRAERRARTRHLIELGGLVTKAGLVERVDDDRATLLGAFLNLRDLLDGTGDDSPADLKARYRRRGLRAFDEHRETQGANQRQTEHDTG